MAIPVESNLIIGACLTLALYVPKMVKTIPPHAGNEDGGDSEDCLRGALAQFLPHSVFERFFPATEHQTNHSQA
jgi:hypothetical protein